MANSDARGRSIKARKKIGRRTERDRALPCASPRARRARSAGAPIGSTSTCANDMTASLWFVMQIAELSRASQGEIRDWQPRQPPCGERVHQDFNIVANSFQPAHITSHPTDRTRPLFAPVRRSKNTQTDRGKLCPNREGSCQTPLKRRLKVPPDAGCGFAAFDFVDNVLRDRTSPCFAVHDSRTKSAPKGG